MNVSNFFRAGLISCQIPFGQTVVKMLSVTSKRKLQVIAGINNHATNIYICLMLWDNITEGIIFVARPLKAQHVSICSSGDKIDMINDGSYC